MKVFLIILLFPIISLLIKTNVTAAVINVDKILTTTGSSSSSSSSWGNNYDVIGIDDDDDNNNNNSNKNLCYSSSSFKKEFDNSIWDVNRPTKECNYDVKLRRGRYCSSMARIRKTSPWYIMQQRLLRQTVQQDTIKKNKINPGTISTKSSNNNNNKDRQRIVRKIKTKFTFQYPTYERVNEWFGMNDINDNDTIVNNRMKQLYPKFNHNMVGMTNPTLLIDDKPDIPIGNIRNNYQQLHKTTTTKTTTTTDDDTVTAPVSMKSKVLVQQRTDNKKLSDVVTNTALKCLEQQLWWPTVTCIPDKRTWRVRRYRQTVGYGYNVYQSCRDAILQWEFHSKSKGIVPVPNHMNQHQHDVVEPATSILSTNNNNNNVQQIWSGPGRRLITYTSSLFGLLYTVNPVTVIYDIVDQKYSNNNNNNNNENVIYTATAYATNQGHLLCGEERVCVLYRPNHNEQVDIEILSYSKPASTLTAKIVWPFISHIQNTFFIDQMKSLHTIATTNNNKQNTKL